MVEPKDKKLERERLQAEALRRRIRLFVRHHPAFTFAVGSYVIGGVIIALYSYFWIGLLPAVSAVNELNLVLLAMALGIFSFFYLFFLILPLFPLFLYYEETRRECEFVITAYGIPALVTLILWCVVKIRGWEITDWQMLGVTLIGALMSAIIAVLAHFKLAKRRNGGHANVLVGAFIFSSYMLFTVAVAGIGITAGYLVLLAGFAWLYLKDKWSFGFLAFIMAGLLGLALVWYKGEPIRVLSLGRFNASCALSSDEFDLIEYEFRRKIGGMQKGRANKGGVQQVLGAPNEVDAKKMLGCEHGGDGTKVRGCAVHVWWALGNTWLVSPSAFGVKNALNRPDIKKGPEFRPFLITLHDAPRRCVRLSNVASITTVSELGSTAD